MAMSDPKPEFSVVVPVYNSSRTLEELHRRLAAVFDETMKATFEMVLVDDSSRDNSWEVMRRQQSKC